MHKLYPYMKATVALISDPVRWTQNDFARDVLGDYVPSGDPDAVKWCATGAWNKSTGGCWSSLSAVLSDLGIKTHITWVNDRQGHAAVMTILNKALAIMALCSA